MKKILLFSKVLFLVVVLACHEKTKVSTGDSSAIFVHEVLPIIEANCLNCHGGDPEKIEGNLNLTSREGFLKGGETHSELVLSARPDFSPIYQAISRQDPETAMPPREREALSEEEVQTFYDWIVAGGAWPSKKEQVTIMAQGARTSTRKRFNLDGQSQSWNERTYRQDDLWSYQQLVRPNVPGGLAEHPVDAFIQAELKASDLQSAPMADAADLLRRASYDLTGLPPNEVLRGSFYADGDFGKVIDELLASPHYGEQMATHWLDIARYGDSDGFSNDFSRPSAWRYRDYVIKSFNEDKPYNRFIIEQIAGDALDASNPENLIATGFLRMGPWEHTGMSVAAETRQYYLDDITNSVGETFLATPLNCARCHDHKYDPIPTKDYYRVQAVFATTQFAQREVPFQEWENTQGMVEEKARIEAWLDRIEEEQQELVDKEEYAAREWFMERGRPYLTKKQRRSLPDHKQPPRYHGLTFEDLGYRKVLQKRKQIENRKLERFQPLAFSTYSGPTRVTHSVRPMPMPENTEGEPQATFVLVGGSVYARDAPVTPGALQVVHAIANDSTDWHDGNLHDGMVSRRIDFAKWLTHPANPITARVIANRIWQWHMGNGLAANENNFGVTGAKPSHPDLLDWLAVELIENDWSIKHLHRIIMSSKTYQRSNKHPSIEMISDVDPNNELLSYFSSRRLSAEEIRDAMLLISGELNSSIGGIPIRPEIPLSVALQPRHTMGSAAPSYQPSRTPDQRNRRSIYIERKRSVENPFMQTFNQAGSEISCEEREASTVVNQAFGLLNSQHTRARSLFLAKRLHAPEIGEEELIQHLYEHILQRSAAPDEVQLSLQYLKSMQEYHHENIPLEVKLPTEVIHEMHEEMTGVAFHFSEYLDVHDDYVYDVTDASVSAEVRALADVATVLFNTNEFLYVY